MTTWHIGESERCGTKKPHAVINDDTGSVEGCHATLREARRHVSRLMSGRQAKSARVWPPPDQIPDRVKASEQVVAALYGEALRRWTPTLMSNVLPTLTAAGLPPDPGAVDAARPKWSTLAERIIVAGMRLLWADTAVTAMRGLGVHVPSYDAEPEFDYDEYAVNAVASALGRDPAEVVESASRLTALPSLASAMNDHIDSIRTYADAIPDKVEAKVERALAEAPDTATIEEMRVTAELVIEPGSVTMEDIAEWTARQAAGVENDAIVQAGRESPDAEQLEKVWIATNDEKTRPTHRDAHGQRVGLDDTFRVGADQLQYPGDPDGSPQEVINCVVGETLVSWPGQDVSHVTRRRHRGTFVHLVTADGHDLTVTANHPILTNAGYVAAHLLSPGQYVMATDPLSPPQIDHMPTRADEIYCAFRETGVEQRVVARAVDFHHDALEGDEVSVIRAEGHLAQELDPRLFGSRDDATLMRLRRRVGDRPRSRAAVDSLLGLSGALSAGRQGRATSGLVGGSGQGSATLLADSGGPDAVSLAAGTKRQTQLPQPSDHSVSANSESVRHRQYAHTFGMKPSKLTSVDVYAASHDVFNFSTTQQWYSASGVAVHNCRCRCTILAGDEELPGYETRAGEQPVELIPADSDKSPDQVLEDAQFTWDVDEAAQLVLPDAYVNFADMDPGNLPIEQARQAAQSAKGAVRACSDVVNTYDNAYENLTAVSYDSAIPDNVFAVTKHWGKGEYAIDFNPRWMNDPAFKAEFDKTVEEGFHYPGTGDPAYDVAVHEMGHVLAGPVMNEDPILTGEIINRALSDYYCGTRTVDLDSDRTFLDYMTWRHENLSGYSLQNADEMVAEAFADAHINGDNAHETSKVIHKLLMDARDGRQYETPDEWPFGPPAEGQGPPPIKRP